MPRRTAVALTLVAVCLALGACTGDASPDPRPTPTSPSTSTPTSTPTSSDARTPVPSPPTADSVDWPIALSEADVMGGKAAAAVWLVVGPDAEIDTWDPITGVAAADGYDVAAMPVGCHDASQAAFGDPNTDVWTGSWGLPVFFASDHDASAFAALWTETTPVVVGVGHMQCDFD